MDTSQLDQTVKYVTQLGPAFAAGFSVQQIVEVVDSLIVWSGKWKPSNDGTVPQKKAVLSLFSLGLATLLVLLDSNHYLDILQAIGASNGKAQSAGTQAVGVLISIAFISAGTEGFNSLLKWLTYKKEDAKATAAQNKGTAQSGTPVANSATGSLHLLPS